MSFELQGILKNLSFELKELLGQSFFKDEYQREINTDVLYAIQKHSIFMSMVSVSEMKIEFEFFEDFCGWVITSFAGRYTELTQVLSNLNRKQLNILLQLPFTVLEQTILSVPDPDNSKLKFQQRMVTDFINILMKLHTGFAGNEHL